jgi:hypothetical protein
LTSPVALKMPSPPMTPVSVFVNGNRSQSGIVVCE